ncbi:DUF6795 domain-containing protein [Bowmanella pacifica]|nr:DUF6795 domain-containing protein [Bowmanella pacifica]
MKTNIAIVLIGLLTSSLGAQAMGFFKKCMFSAVEGTVLSDGKPVEGVKVKRRYLWGAAEEEKIDYTTTNSAGRFSFPALYSSSLSVSLLPLHEAGVNQYIIFEYDNKEFDGWSFRKRNYELGGEKGESPLNLVCDLTSSAQINEDGGYLEDYYGVCKVVK